MWNYKTVGQVRFWVQKVLPLVYDDSLSYYELISKIVGKLNEVIENTNMIPDLIKQEILKFLEDEEDELKKMVDEFIEEYLKGEKHLVLTSDLTSNDIDIEPKFTIHMDDGRNTGSTTYCVFQSLMRMPDGNFAVVSNDERGGTENGVVRIYTPSGNLVKTSGVLEVGHAQDSTTDGNNIYVCHSINKDGERTNKVSVISYPDLSLVEVKTISKIANAIAYDSDKGRFITKEDNIVTFWDRDLNEPQGTLTIPEEFSTTYKGNYYPAVARQGTCYYNGMLMCIYSFPNMFVFYDLETGELVKYYNPPYVIGNGSIFDEIEDAWIDEDKNMWIVSFSITSDAKYGMNTIAKCNPWTNVPTNYAKHARYIVPMNIYVDGSTTNPMQNGTLHFPYKNLTQAMACLKGQLSGKTPINIYCKEGTNVGCLRITQASNVNITHYGEGGAGTGTGTYTVEGMRIIECNQVFINYANCVRNAKLNDDYNSPAYVDRTQGALFANSVFTGGDDAIFLRLGAKLDLRDCELKGYTQSGVQVASQSYLTYNSGTTFSGVPYELQYGNVTVPTKMKPQNAIVHDQFPLLAPMFLISDTINSTGSYQLFNGKTIDATARRKYNFVLFDVGIAGKSQIVPVRIPVDAANDREFALPIVLASGTTGVIEGRFNIISGTLSVTSMTNNARIYEVLII